MRPTQNFNIYVLSFFFFLFKEFLGAPGVNISQSATIIAVSPSLLFQYQEAIVM
jgi:hypothetical protein